MEQARLIKQLRNTVRWLEAEKYPPAFKITKQRHAEVQTKLDLTYSPRDLERHITELKLRARLERAERNNEGLQTKVNQLRSDATRQKKDIGVLKDQMAIYRQENQLFKESFANKDQQPPPPSPNETAELRTTVVNEINRRRGRRAAQPEPTSLPEQRANDKGAIMEMLKDYKHHLTPWKDILENLLAGRESKPAKKLPWSNEFIDGMEIATSVTLGPRELRRMLKNHGINATQP